MSDILWELLLQGVLSLLCVVGSAGFMYLTYQLLSLPMRRQESVEMLLDLLETAEGESKPLESAVAMALSTEPHFSARFQTVVKRLGNQFPLLGPLEGLPRTLPPQIVAILEVGIRLGEVRKVIPACQQWLNDSKSRVLGATNYVIPLTLFLSPIGLLFFIFLTTVILPKFREIFYEMMGDASLPVLTQWIFEYRGLLALIQALVFLVCCGMLLVYLAGPNLATGFHAITDRLAYWVPWRRKRLQRDFSLMLSILLDAGLPEAQAVDLAAQSTANGVLIRRAQAAVRDLESGMVLTEAVQRLDETGEFRWRLRNAVHAHGGFAAALAGWHESLDAKAYQLEQAAAHVISTALVLVNGIVIAIVAVGLFQPLIAIVHEGALW